VAGERKARQDAVPKCEAFREARRNKACAAAEISKLWERGFEVKIE
jgi:hypothetical protein